MLFCTVTALGLVRLVCQPKLMGAAVKTLAEASSLLDAFCQQPGVSLASEERAGWEVFHQLLRNGEVPPVCARMPTWRPWRSPMAGCDARKVQPRFDCKLATTPGDGTLGL